MADNFTVLDGAGLSRTLNTAESGGVHTPRHDIHALPGTVESDIGFLKTFLQTLAGIVTTGRAAVNVDTVTTGKLDSITTALGSYLATLAGAITSSRMAVNVDSTTTGKLDTLHTDLAVPTVMYGGKTTVTTAGTRVVLASSQAITKGVWVRALDANTGLIYVGTSSVSSTAAGTRLAPGESIWIDIANLTTVNVDAAVNGEGVTYLGW
jgi:hypothetical protein